MRINKFVALATGMSRRRADDQIKSGKVLINGQLATSGQQVEQLDAVSLNGKLIVVPEHFTTIMLNKPIGYVCSREGQGSKTIYDLLPSKLHNLKPVGRLDKDSSGLLLLTNNGELANALTHPKHQKTKVYEIILDKPLSRLDWSSIHEQGIRLEDGLSKLFLERLKPYDDKHWQVTMHEGRNHQIRRTFAAISYTVVALHRISFGEYHIGKLLIGQFSVSIWSNAG